MDAWGKYESPDCFHRLEHHCADVAACFEALLRDPVLRNRFERAAGDADFCAVTEARLTVIAFLHDFGKLNAGFQWFPRTRGDRPRVEVRWVYEDPRSGQRLVVGVDRDDGAPIVYSLHRG